MSQLELTTRLICRMIYIITDDVAPMFYCIAPRDCSLWGFFYGYCYRLASAILQKT